MTQCARVGTFLYPKNETLLACRFSTELSEPFIEQTLYLILTKTRGGSMTSIHVEILLKLLQSCAMPKQKIPNCTFFYTSNQSPVFPFLRDVKRIRNGFTLDLLWGSYVIPSFHLWNSTFKINSWLKCNDVKTYNL